MEVKINRYFLNIYTYIVVNVENSIIKNKDIEKKKHIDLYG